MLTDDQIRTALHRPDMPTKEVEAFRRDLYAWLNRALDEYFQLADSRSMPEQDR